MSCNKSNCEGVLSQMFKKRRVPTLMLLLGVHYVVTLLIAVNPNRQRPFDEKSHVSSISVDWLMMATSVLSSKNDVR